MNIDDLKITAQLAHLNMTGQELDAAYPAFEQMLGYFAAMQAADEDTAAFTAPLAKLAAASQTVSADFFRSDNPHCNLNNSHTTSSNGLNDQTLVCDLLNNAGDRDGRFIVVPNVL
jgi:aspartyl-tRNA(Asn)/glutamyl-tRNA(Gln) amidotransferase subunit C